MGNLNKKLKWHLANDWEKNQALTTQMQKEPEKCPREKMPNP